jgi:hypothetical protein
MTYHPIESPLQPRRNNQQPNVREIAARITFRWPAFSIGKSSKNELRNCAIPTILDKLDPRSVRAEKVFSTRRISRSNDLSAGFLKRHRIVNSVSSEFGVDAFCRDRTESTESTTEGISFGEIINLTGGATFEEALDRAVNGGCKAAVGSAGGASTGEDR